MDPQIEKDFAEVLGDLDPLESLLQDPLLAEVAEEVLNSSQEDIPYDSDTVSFVSSSPNGKHDASCSNKLSDVDHSTPATTCLDNYKLTRYAHKCVCCGRPAKGIQYFGAKICNGCKSFFARSVKDNMYKNYLCVNDCKVSVDAGQSWLKCQYCRFDQLCKVGLRISKNTKKNRAVDRHFTDQTRLLLVNSITLSVEETLRVEKITVTVSKMGLEFFGRLAKENEHVLPDYLKFLYHGREIPLSTLKVTFDYLLFGFKQIIDETNSWMISGKLSSRDINRLIVANYPLCQEILEACKMNESKQGEIEDEIDAIMMSAMEGLDITGKSKVNKIHTEVSTAIYLSQHKVLCMPNCK